MVSRPGQGEWNMWQLGKENRTKDAQSGGCVDKLSVCSFPHLWMSVKKTSPKNSFIPYIYLCWLLVQIRPLLNAPQDLYHFLVANTPNDLVSVSSSKIEAHGCTEAVLFALLPAQPSAWCLTNKCQLIDMQCCLSSREDWLIVHDESRKHTFRFYNEDSVVLINLALRF